MTQTQDIGTCDYCGEELPMDQLFELKGKRLPGHPAAYAVSDYYCPTCKVKHADHFEDAADDHDYLGGGY